MPKTRPPYRPEFRAEAVRLVRAGDTSLSQVARDLGASNWTLRLWVKRAQIEAGEREGLTSEERAEPSVVLRVSRGIQGRRRGQSAREGNGDDTGEKPAALLRCHRMPGHPKNEEGDAPEARPLPNPLVA